MLIVTHFNPDIDAICAVWLLKKFGPEKYDNAKVEFVAAGSTYQNKEVDSDEGIVHVDTGLGQFDHHQFKDDEVCAASLVFDDIKKELGSKDREALSRLVDVICQIDHFKECLWPEPEADYYQLMLMDLLDGLKTDNELDNRGVVDFGSVCLTGIWQSFKQKIRAEKEIKKGICYQTYWGKSLFMETGNIQSLHLAQKKGYNLVVRKDPKRGLVKIGLRPDAKLNLDLLYQKLKSQDKKADWYYHPSGRLLLNGSTKNPMMRPSQLKILELVSIIKSIKK